LTSRLTSPESSAKYNNHPHLELRKIPKEFYMVAHGASFIVNRILRPAMREAGESLGEMCADFVGASGERRREIVNRARTGTMVVGSLCVSAALADGAGILDAAHAADAAASAADAADAAGSAVDATDAGSTADAAPTAGSHGDVRFGDMTWEGEDKWNNKLQGGSMGLPQYIDHPEVPPPPSSEIEWK
jgi:hypothetical protein